MKSNWSRQISDTHKRRKRQKSQKKVGCNYEFVVDMEHENAQQVLRESKRDEERNLPTSAWATAVKVEKARKKAERTTGQILTSNNLQAMLSNTTAKLKRNDSRRLRMSEQRGGFSDTMTAVSDHASSVGKQ